MAASGEGSPPPAAGEEARRRGATQTRSRTRGPQLFGLERGGEMRRGMSDFGVYIQWHLVGNFSKVEW